LAVINDHSNIIRLYTPHYLVRHNNAKYKHQKKKKNFRRDGIYTTNATVITDDSTQIPKFPYSERIIILLKLINSGRHSQTLTSERRKKKVCLFTPYIGKKSHKENARISRSAKKKEKKIQVQIVNIRGLYLLNSALPPYNFTLFSTAMGFTLGTKICDDRVASGIRRIPQEPSTIVNRTIKAIRDNLKSL